jgi:hypothetical protein
MKLSHEVVNAILISGFHLSFTLIGVGLVELLFGRGRASVQPAANLGE